MVSSVDLMFITLVLASVSAFCQHADNHVGPANFLGQPLPPPASSGRFSPTPKSMLGDDDIAR